MERDTKQVESNFIAEWNRVAENITSVRINDEKFTVLKVSKIDTKCLSEVTLIVASDIVPNYYDEIDFEIADTVRYTADELIELFLDYSLQVYTEEPYFIKQV